MIVLIENILSSKFRETQTRGGRALGFFSLKMEETIICRPFYSWKGLPEAVSLSFKMKETIIYIPLYSRRGLQKHRHVNGWTHKQNII